MNRKGIIMYQLIQNYRDNDALRASFNELARKTFGLNFEDWYQNGFWSDSYRPYSIAADGRIVSNVSVNQTDLCTPGGVKHFLQLGTVMTDVPYRKKGLCKEIMQKILADYDGKCDGIYLFANDSVLDFYPRFGFTQAKEYQYTKKITNTGKNQFRQVPMDGPSAWKKLEEAMKHTVFHGQFDLIGNPGLIFFYVTKFMQGNVFCHDETDTYVIIETMDEASYTQAQETEKNRILLHNAFSATLTSLDDIISLLGEAASEVTLGFTPMEPELWQAAEHHEEDCTFFIRGDALKMVEADRLRIPSLAHA